MVIQKYVKTDVRIPFISLHRTKKGMFMPVSLRKSAHCAITETPPKLTINAPKVHFSSIGDGLFKREFTPHVISSIPESIDFTS